MNTGNDGYYFVNENGNLIKDGNETGSMYYCRNKKCSSYSKKLGYYQNADTSNDNNVKYIKCYMKYYMTTTEKSYYKKSQVEADNNNNRRIYKRQKDGGDTKTGSTSNSSSYRRYNYFEKQICEGIPLEAIDTSCHNPGQLITKNDKVSICLSKDDDENVLSFAEGNTSSSSTSTTKNYKIIGNNILNVNINSTRTEDFSLTNMVVEINKNYIEIGK